MSFLATFSSDSKSASNSSFFIPLLHFWERKTFSGSYWHFLQTLKANVDEMLKKTEKLFYKCVSELNFVTINGLGDQVATIVVP
jgi:hypothetical protein